MTKNEAEEWLLGNRSMTNLITQCPFETWEVRISQADAAMMEQAYWVLKAYNEGLIVKEQP